MSDAEPNRRWQVTAEIARDLTEDDLESITGAVDGFAVLVYKMNTRELSATLTATTSSEAVREFRGAIRAGLNTDEPCVRRADATPAPPPDADLMAAVAKAFDGPPPSGEPYQRRSRKDNDG